MALGRLVGWDYHKDEVQQNDAVAVNGQMMLMVIKEDGEVLVRYVILLEYGFNLVYVVRQKTMIVSLDTLLSWMVQVSWPRSWIIGGSCPDWVFNMAYCVLVGWGENEAWQLLVRGKNYSNWCALRLFSLQSSEGLYRLLAWTGWSWSMWLMTTLDIFISTRCSAQKLLANITGLIPSTGNCRVHLSDWTLVAAKKRQSLVDPYDEPLSIDLETDHGNKRYVSPSILYGLSRQ